MGRPKLQILECTLRDGSYIIDFQFTVRDTVLIAAALENAGLSLLEVGHGMGLNASASGKGEAAATDEEYMEGVAKTLKRAKWGMFFIPGIGRHEDLEMGSRYGMSFVRIGTNATEADQSKAYIERAKNLGMRVWANLMKSYALSPKELAAQARLSEKFGADVICLVDSAGCMLPEDIRDYMAALRDTLGVAVGFHCHDNLALGMANVIAAVDSGAQFIDTTLQGMGRGGGNPPTEVLVTVLKKRGIDLGIDVNRLMDISGRIIKPMLKDKGLDPIDITSGYAGFHSSYLKTILKYADIYGVDPRDLIVGVCRVDQVYAPEKLVEDTAKRLKKRQTRRAGLHTVALPYSVLSTPEETPDQSLGAIARKVAIEVRATAKKGGSQSVFNIVAAPEPVGKATVSRFIQEGFNYVIGSVEVDNPAQVKEVIGSVDGVVDILLVDSEAKPYLDHPLRRLADRLARQSKVMGYKDNDVWVHSVDRQIEGILQGVCGRRVTVFGTDNLALKLVLSLVERGAEILLTGDTPERLDACVSVIRGISITRGGVEAKIASIEAASSADLLVAFARKRPPITRAVLEVVRKDCIIFDAGIGAVSKNGIVYGNQHGLRIVRPDMRAALAAELTSGLGAQRTVTELMGRSEMGGVPVVAGGLVGRRGEVIVDSVSNPSRVVGVADGEGTVIYERRRGFAERLEKVENEILRRQVLADDGR
jgi:4-hydroxy-2-oxovalerate aldolase